MKTRSSVERWLPVGYFALSVALIIAILPTTLRPPPQQPPTSAQFNPNEPPDEQQILSTLNQGRSRTAGTTLDASAPGEDALSASAPPAVAGRARKGRCFGNPPRQVESVYSAPCAPAFVGNNGGATSRGVTATEIKIGALMELTGTASDGCIDNPTDNESANRRTYRILGEYFNQRFELYGRRIRFCYVTAPSGSSGEDGSRARARRAAQEYGVFAAIQETNPAEIDELLKNKVVTFTLAQVPSRFYAESYRRPYLWSFTPDATSMIRLGAEYICKKLNGKPPKFTNDPLFDQSKPRKFGIIAYESLAAYADNPNDMKRMLSDGCGAKVDEVVRYSYSAEVGPGEFGTAMAKMRAAGVTTIVYLGDLLAAAGMSTAADANSYFPEWFLPGYGGVDTDIGLARAYAQDQWRHAFGFSVYEMPVAVDQRECNFAYRSIDPDNAPNPGMCNYMWGHLVQMMSGMQLAGPKLTVETFSAGLLKLGRSKPNPTWRVAGGYGPGDYTYPDYAAEIWWDPNALAVDGSTGSYRYVRGGKRYTYGEWPREDSLVFKDGVTAPPSLTETPD